MYNIKSMLQYTKVLTILYVEDDNILLESTKKVFDNYFKNVDTAADGVEGLRLYDDYYKKNGLYYDLIITDINMPNMDGMAMSEEILNINDIQAIIITTAHNEVQKLQEAIDIGVSGFITKPIKHDKLNNILYKISRAVSDHLFVESHITQIENLNIKLEEQNKELKSKNEELDKSLRMLDTVIKKDQIIQSEIKAEETMKIAEADAEEKEQKIEQIKLLIEDDLYELKEVLSEIDVIIIEIINNVNEIDINSLNELILLFSRYASVLSFYTIFDELSVAMADFSVTLKENSLPDDVENIKNIFMLLETFMYVLDKWHIDLSSGDENKINSLDASIINDMHTIRNMWTQKEEEISEDLNDIFDF